MSEEQNAWAEVDAVLKEIDSELAHAAKQDLIGAAVRGDRAGMNTALETLACAERQEPIEALRAFVREMMHLACARVQLWADAADVRSALERISEKSREELEALACEWARAAYRGSSRPSRAN